LGVALEGAVKRIENVEDEVTAMRELPAAVSHLAATVEGLSDSHRELRSAHLEAGKDEVRRFEAMRRDLGKVSDAVTDLAKTVAERFDRVDLAHENAAPKKRGLWGIDWPMVLAVVTGITVPIVAVLIAKGG
jgi:hypothetical protein